MELWSNSIVPVAGLPGMMGESDNYSYLDFFDDHNGKGESLKNQSFGA